jgi:hypothetical protein
VREARRYEVTRVPAPVRNRDRLIGTGEPVLPRYERIVFEKSLISPQGEPMAAFVCPGHPLLDPTLDLTLDRHRDILRRGTVLVDDRDSGKTPRVLFYLERGSSSGVSETEPSSMDLRNSLSSTSADDGVRIRAPFYRFGTLAVEIRRLH